MTTYRFGKQPPKNDSRTLRLDNYLKAGVSPPPAPYDVLCNGYNKLDLSEPAKVFPMDGNDRLGECMTATSAHAAPADLLSTCFDADGFLADTQSCTQALAELIAAQEGLPALSVKHWKVINLARATSRSARRR